MFPRSRPHIRVSSDGRTWTFTLRAGFRFSDGTPVRASAFAHAIYRTLAPGVRSPGGSTRYILGAPTSGGEDNVAGGSDRPRQHAGRPLHAPGSGLPVRDDDAVFLRRAAGAAGRPGRTSAPSRRPGRTTSPNTAPGSASCSGGTASTGARGRATSTASSSTSRRVPARRPRSGRAGRGRLGHCTAPLFFDRLTGWSPSTASTGRGSSSSPGSMMQRLQPEHFTPAFPRQPASEAGRELRRRPAALARADGTPLFARPTDQYLPPGCPDSTMPGSTRSAPICGRRGRLHAATPAAGRSCSTRSNFRRRLREGQSSLGTWRRSGSTSR